VLSTTMFPQEFSSRSGAVAVRSGLALVPMALTTTSAGRSNSDPSTGTGLRRPEASGGPSSILRQRSRDDQPSLSLTISSGAVSMTNSTPSSLACLISSTLAGISASLLR